MLQWRGGGVAGVLEPHAAQYYNVPAAATQAIQSPAGGQESLWRKETRGGKGREEEGHEGGSEEKRQKGQSQTS